MIKGKSSLKLSVASADLILLVTGILAPLTEVGYAFKRFNLSEWYSMFTCNMQCLTRHVKCRRHKSNRWRSGSRTCGPRSNRAGHIQVVQTESTAQNKHPVEAYEWLSTCPARTVSHALVESTGMGERSCNATGCQPSDKSASACQRRWRHRLESDSAGS